MCEVQRDVLAIIKLRKRNFDQEIHCVCSRVFVRNKEEKYQEIIEETVEVKHAIIEKVPTGEGKSKLDVEPEHLSCYHSASHTDTLSTDEHDSLKESLIDEEKSPLTGNESSDSGADSIEDAIPEFQKFWSLNGERLIWESWIEKYSAYIDPDFLVNSTTKTTTQRFTFGDDEIVTYQKTTNRKDELSGSDELINKDISEGWNPLSPSSIVGGETEAEQLLGPRCGSYTSGSVRTVDSMTNVTRMTVSSIDFNRSSTDSLSSVTSVESSISSNSSEIENQQQEDQETEDNNEKQWNFLWKKHYHDEYLVQYNKFMVAKESNQKQENRNEILTIDTLENIISNMKMSDESVEDMKTNDEMAALGLPTAFGKSNENCRTTTKKRSVDDANFNASRNKIRAAFNLLGVEFCENKGDLMSGEVDYKMKHIRLQNRLLKLRSDVKRPRHTYFDDDGNAILENDESRDEENYQSILSDCSENKLSSCEEEIDQSEEKDSTQFMKKKKRKKKPNIPVEIRDNAKLKKYWWRRFSLFSRFDEGIKLDEESWYSVTPELVAKHLAERCKNDIIIDAFCGAGGNTIQFALTCKKVIAIDIDPNKIEMAKNNAEVYGVSDKVEFIVGDFLALAPNLKGDVVFMSPPWGGPSYMKKSVYDLEKMLQPVPYSKLIDVARAITGNIAVFLPKNSNTHDAISYAVGNGEVEIEQNFLNKRLIAITVYYNDLIRKS